MKKLVLMLLLTFLTTVSFAREVSLEDKITSLYVAYFNRAPDFDGLEYWKGLGEKAQNEGKNVSDVLKQLSLGFSSHPTFVSTYSSLTNKEFVEAIYQNALGKNGDLEGINYWTSTLDNGKSRSDMVAEFMESSLTLDLTSQNFPNLTEQELQSAKDRQNLITNKVDVALYFTNTLGDKTNVKDSQHPEDDSAYIASKKILEGIDTDLSKVQKAKGKIAELKNNPNAITTINNN